MAFILLPQSATFLVRHKSAIRLSLPGWVDALLAVALIALLAAGLILGLRSLSVDYMLRVSSIVHGGANVKSKPRRRRHASAISGWFGGQPGRAAFKFVGQMMPREWHFMRRAASLGLVAILSLPAMVHGLRISPFSGRFTAFHVFPHVFGFMSFMVCTLIAYGSDYKASWSFLLAPAGALERFARGIFGLFWIGFVVVPHLFALPVLIWFWGVRSAVIFVAYSLAVASLYLGVALRFIEGVPFSRRPQVSGSYMTLPAMLIGSMVAAGAVALQYFFIFRSMATVLATTAVIAAAAWFVTRNSLERLSGTMRYKLGLLSGESSFLYKEIIT